MPDAEYERKGPAYSVLCLDVNLESAVSIPRLVPPHPNPLPQGEGEDRAETAAQNPDPLERSLRGESGLDGGSHFR